MTVSVNASQTMSRLEVNPEEEFHVVLNGQQTSLSLDALAEAYEADQINDETLIWQPSFPSWLPLARVLAELDAEDEQAGTSVASLPPGMYQVNVSPGDVRQMTYEQLKDALRLGALDPDSLVWQAGYTEWLPLSAVLADKSSLEHVSVHPSAPGGVVMSQRPALRSDGPSLAPPPGSRATIPGPGSIAPRAEAPSFSPAAPSAPPALRTDGPSLAPAAPSARPPLRNDGPSLAPAAPSGRPPLRNDGPSLAPAAPSARPPLRNDGPSLAPAAPVSMGPGSLAPHGSLPARPAASVAPPSLTPYDLPQIGSDDEEAFAKPKKKILPVAGVAVLAAAVAMFALYRNGVGASSSGSVNAAGAIAPDTDTPEGMKNWLSKVNGKYPSDAAPETGPSSSAPSPSTGLKLAELPKDEEPSSSASASSSAEPSSRVADLLKGKKETAAAKTTKAAKSVSSSAAKAPKKTSSKSTGSAADAYDPMNGTL